MTQIERARLDNKRRVDEYAKKYETSIQDQRKLDSSYE
jgi:hypothetical protein